MGKPRLAHHGLLLGEASAVRRTRHVRHRAGRLPVYHQLFGGYLAVVVEGRIGRLSIIGGVGLCRLYIPTQVTGTKVDARHHVHVVGPGSFVLPKLV
jgi:hypothetical protein